MNKIISANINGFVFSVDELAYEKLSAYLEKIRNKVNSFEVMTDIENRIAELFDYKIKNGKAAILDEDVEDIMAQIGSPEQFGSEEDAQEERKNEGYSQNRKRYRRLYRNEDDKVVGGVCSGIAAYFQIDPLFIRLGFGAAFFMFGTGLLLYLFLMVILPKAHTPSEKLEMMGEPVDFKNLSKTIEKDFKDAYVKYKPDVKSGFERFLEILVKIGAVVLILFLISIFVPVSIGLFTSIGFASWTLPVLTSYMFTSPAETTLIVVGLIFFFIVPVIGLLYKLIRVLIKAKPMNKFVSIGLALIWFTGFCMLAYSTYNIGQQFSYTHRSVEEDTLKLASAETSLVIKAVGDYNQSTYRNHDFYDDDVDVKITSRQDLESFLDDRIGENVRLRISRGYEQQPMIRIVRQSAGKSREEARFNSDNIEYSYMFKDSILYLDKFLKMGNTKLWRNQKIIVEIEVPQNQKLILDKSCRRMNKDHYDYFYKKKRKNKDKSIYGKPMIIDEDGNFEKVEMEEEL